MDRQSDGLPGSPSRQQIARRPLHGYLWAALAITFVLIAAFLLGLVVGLQADDGPRAVRPLLALALGALGVAAATSLLAYRVFVSPIRLVASFLSRLATGHGDLSVRIPAGVPVPVRDLANGANDFIRHLNEDLTELRAATTKFSVFSQDIASSSDKLSASSEIQVHEMIDVSRTLDRFNDTLQTINGQIETQVANIDETSDAIDELTRGMGSIVETSTNIKNQVGDTVGSAEQSHDRISGSLDQSESMHSVVASLSEKMERLAQHSDQISQIVRVIQDISERTHVLATNASIQAAKAGDAGRGFAVVAGQIRELSNGTSRSVSEIDKLMHDTVTSIREAMSETQRVRSFTDDFRESAAQSHQALHRITDDIETIDKMVALIADEVRRQEEATEQVRGNAESLLAFSESVKAQIAEQAERSNQIISVIELARTNSENYAQASKTLSQLGKYLTVGVDLLKRVLARYVLDSSEVVVAYHRSAPRVRNVYSLEITDQSLEHEIGYLDDLSLTGLKMLTRRSVHAGQIMDIAILPSKVSNDVLKPCELKVEVRWVEDEVRSTYRQVGCKIVDATPANRERLAALIAQAEELQEAEAARETPTVPLVEDVEDLEEVDEQ